ncbi:MAG: YceI family protein [Actinomycetota bacterium]
MTTTTPTSTPGSPPDDGSPGTSRRRRLLMLTGGAAVVVVLLAGAGLWWFFRDDAPAEVDLATAVEQVAPAEEAADNEEAPLATEAAGATSTTNAASAAEAGDISGTWTVDTSIGEFDYESATGSFAGFRIEEELRGVGSTTAVGRTGGVDGTITIEGTTLTTAEITADLSQVTTDDSRRDDETLEALNTDEFPTATFVLTESVELPDGAVDGDPVAVTAVGELTISGVTQPVEIPMEAQLVDGVIVVVGSLDLVFADYGVAVPSAAIIVSVEDHGVMELQLLFTPAA